MWKKIAWKNDVWNISNLDIGLFSAKQYKQKVSIIIFKRDIFNTLENWKKCLNCFLYRIIYY